MKLFGPRKNGETKAGIWIPSPGKIINSSRTILWRKNLVSVRRFMPIYVNVAEWDIKKKFVALTKRGSLIDQNQTQSSSFSIKARVGRKFRHVDTQSNNNIIIIIFLFLSRSNSAIQNCDAKTREMKMNQRKEKFMRTSQQEENRELLQKLWSENSWKQSEVYWQNSWICGW